MAIGGCASVPGGLLLTVEAALRAGAGKVRAATVSTSAVPLGIAMPEMAVIPLEETAQGEIAVWSAQCDHDLERSDAVVLGPAMGCARAAGQLVDRLLTSDLTDRILVLDAAALMELPDRSDSLASLAGGVILTPHIGEMAAMLGCEAGQVDADRPGAVRNAAVTYNSVVVLKGATSLVASPDGSLFSFAGGGVGLATGGSGDVLAGIAAGLAARGASALDAALWSVWLHGEAGRRCAEQIGPLGFLARELLAHLPSLMRAI